MLSICLESFIFHDDCLTTCQKYVNSNGLDHTALSHAYLTPLYNPNISNEADIVTNNSD